VKGDEPLEAALQELLKGLSGAEKRGGLLSAMPERLALRGITVKNRTAYIDFNDAFEENAIGNIIQSRIDQIVYTATQFEDVDGVIIQVNGVAKKFVGGDGVVLNNPLTRRHH
jgi:spore germination protein GerM